MSERLRVLRVDLTGSRLGPSFKGAALRVDQPQQWSDDRLRQECADYYAISIDQVRLDPEPESSG